MQILFYKSIFCEELKLWPNGQVIIIFFFFFHLLLLGLHGNFAIIKSL